MRVATKQIHARNDCFEAAEGSARVRIAALRDDTVLVSADFIGQSVAHEMALPAFARALVNAVGEAKGFAKGGV